jgi:cystathionine beta-lyase/cystathionine gamma-synthase
MSYSELSTEELAKIGIDPALVRMAVGIEDTADLVRDLEQALLA